MPRDSAPRRTRDEASPLKGGTRVRFLDWTADLNAAELFRNGEKIPLQDKPFQVLLTLMRRPGELVSRKEIRSAVWPKGGLQADASLNTAVRKLRRALGDSSKQPRIIQTVDDAGYRFIPEIEQTEPAPLSGGRDLRIIVTPLQNLSGPEFDYFADSLTEQMIVQLADPESHLKVIEPVLAPMHRKPALDLSAIGKEFGADYVLGGTMIMTGDVVRISARLIRVADGACVWSENHPREVRESFRAQDEITLGVACSILRILPKPPVTSMVAENGSEAREKDLKGRHFAAKWNEPAFLRAVSLLEEAIAHDPNYARAHSSLARTRASMLQYGVLEPRVNHESLLIHSKKALELNPELAEAVVARGCDHFFYEANWAAAEEAFQLAMRMRPDFAYVYQAYARLLLVTGRHEESIAAARRARELNPLSPYSVIVLAVVYCFSRRFVDAIQPSVECIEMEPGFVMGHAFLGRAYEGLGRYDSAIESYRQGLNVAPDSVVTMAKLAHGLTLAGQHAEARQLLNRLLSLRDSVYVPSYWIALVYIGLGEIDEGFKWLHQAVEERCGWRLLTSVDPKLDAIRDDARFIDILKAIGFPQVS